MRGSKACAVQQHPRNSAFYSRTQCSRTSCFQPVEVCLLVPEEQNNGIVLQGSTYSSSTEFPEQDRSTLGPARVAGLFVTLPFLSCYTGHLRQSTKDCPRAEAMSLEEVKKAWWLDVNSRSTKRTPRCATWCSPLSQRVLARADGFETHEWSFPWNHFFASYVL